MQEAWSEIVQDLSVSVLNTDTGLSLQWSQKGQPLWDSQAGHPIILRLRWGTQTPHLNGSQYGCVCGTNFQADKWRQWHASWGICWGQDGPAWHVRHTHSAPLLKASFPKSRLPCKDCTMCNKHRRGEKDCIMGHWVFSLWFQPNLLQVTFSKYLPKEFRESPTAF